MLTLILIDADANADAYAADAYAADADTDADTSIHVSEWRNQKSERNRNRNFFPIPKFFDTESDTFFDTKIFRNRYRYFFRYQKFSKPIPILFSKPIFSETDTNTNYNTIFSIPIIIINF